MSSLRIVLGNSSLAGYPQGGGHWALFLQYLLGLQALGHDVFWLELFGATEDAPRDDELIRRFFERFRAYGLEDRCAVLRIARGEAWHSLQTAEPCGKSRQEIREIAQSADLLWNFCAAVRQPLLALFRRRAFVDLDPGILQISALDWEMGLDDHHVLLSVGRNLHASGCEVPTLGKEWQPFFPFVYLPMWEAAPDPGDGAPFTSVTQWNWGELWLRDRILSAAKRDAYLRYVDLPRQAARAFELAANIHPLDQTGDRDRLLSHGWRLVDPHEVAGSPLEYQQYLAVSRAEISCPKPIYRELKTGWLSDRTACYLASGRPVLAEDTGFSAYLPTGAGLLTFGTLAEAIEGVAQIDADYARHSRAARELAAAHLDSRQWLPAMLSACGA
jgi:hypothetical protein